jgi:hypothetical protein
VTVRTIAEQKAMMEFYDNASPALRDLLKDFDHDEIVKCGTALGTNDYEQIGKFLRSALKLVDGTKAKLGDAFLASTHHRQR